MEVVNPKLLPEELIRIANYYSGQTNTPFALRAFVRDPFAKSDVIQRRGISGEYRDAEAAIYLFLAKTLLHQTIARIWPPPMGLWVSVLHVLLHEIGHHLQRADPDYCDDEGEVGYRRSWPERDARQFAEREIHRLADLDDNLFMPMSFGALGWLGIVALQQGKAMAEYTRQEPSASWRETHIMRAMRLRAVPVRKWETQLIESKQEGGKCHWGKRLNPMAKVAEQEGVVWHDKRGHQFRYLRVGQAVRYGMVNDCLERE